MYSIENLEFSGYPVICYILNLYTFPKTFVAGKRVKNDLTTQRLGGEGEKEICHQHDPQTP